MTLREYQIKSDGYFLRLERQWEHTRYLAHYLYAQVTGKPKSPKKLIPLIFDNDHNEEKVKPVTKQEVEEFERKWLRKK